MNLDQLYSAFLQSSGVTTDSRHCPQGSLFFALKGVSFDGNKYAEQALASGCAYAVVDDPSLPIQDTFFLVDDVLKALQQLAWHHRKVLATPIIGITGSNGKTTTKELLAAVLSARYDIHYTQGNFNNHIGVPLTLLGIKPEHQLAIVEMGANHPGEIGDLCDIVEPDYGIITNIGKAHLEGFGGIEGVIKTKKELYDSIRSRNGKVYVNAQDELLLRLSEGIKCQYYNGRNAEFRVMLRDVLPSLELQVEGDGVNDILSTQLAGAYNLTNIAAALEIGADFDVVYDLMKRALEAYVPSNNRSQIIEKADCRIILDAYNANPASMAVAVENFADISADRKILVLGAMKELGEYSKAEHQNLIDLAVQKKFDRVIVIGQEFDDVDDKPDAVEFYLSLEQFIAQFEKEQNTSYLIKGSRGMKMERLLDCL